MADDLEHEVGSDSPTGGEIEFIFGKTDKVLVYREKGGTIGHFIDRAKHTKLERGAISEYQSLRARVLSVLPKTEWGQLLDGLASALFYGLTASDKEGVEKAFEDVGNLVLRRTTSYGRLFYVFSAFASFVVVELLLYLAYFFNSDNEHSVYLLFLMFAGAGSMASIMVRVSKIEVKEFERVRLIVAKGSFRVIIGILFAAFFIAASKANLVVGIVAETGWSLAAFSFISGFSEYFVPEILKEISDKGNDD